MCCIYHIFICITKWPLGTYYVLGSLFKYKKFTSHSFSRPWTILTTIVSVLCFGIFLSLHPIGVSRLIDLSYRKTPTKMTRSNPRVCLEIGLPTYFTHHSFPNFHTSLLYFRSQNLYCTVGCHRLINDILYINPLVNPDTSSYTHHKIN